MGKGFAPPASTAQSKPKPNQKLNPQSLEQVLAKWLQQILGSVAQEVVPIDGKTLKGAECRARFPARIEFELGRQFL